ncbi:MAG: FAD-dependent oxidoreductase [Chloroflexia bacterium]|nr:FAD-dependent oxidoreductase [Chloroflexia bacterium]
MSQPEVVVVGGGPAGLGAAVLAARCGARVVLVDECLVPGGQLRYRSGPVRAAPGLPPEPPAVLADRLVVDAIAAGVDIVSNAVIWAVFADGALALSNDGRPSLLRPAVVVVATGSTDLPLPFAGGSLPGVFSARAVLIAVNMWRVRPGRRWALVGGGPERDEVAAAIAEAGGVVAATADPATGDAVAAAGGSGVETVVINGRRIPIDCVAVTAGRQSDAALAVMAGCAMRADSEGRGFVPVVDAFGRSTNARLVIAGDAAGICSPEVVLAEGRVAGVAAAAAVGLATGDQLRGALDRESGVLAERLAARSNPVASFVQSYR